MLALDRDALICDLAEVYHVYDMEALPAEYVATLAAGLRENSRIRQKATGEHVDTATLLLCYILDAVNWIAWTKTKDAEKGKNRPKSVAAMFSAKTSETASFSSSEDFEAAKAAILERFK